MRFLDDEIPQLQDLYGFVIAAQARSMTAAATAHGVAQSALSRQIERLEKKLGGKLLHRTGRGVALTELGTKVLPRAQTLVSEARALALDVNGQWGQPSGIVRVGLLPSLVRPVATRLYLKARELFPAVQLRLHEAYSGDVQSMLAEGTVDVGTVNRYRPTQRDRKDGVLTSLVCLIVSSRSCAAAQESCRVSDLPAHPLVVTMAPNSLRSYLEEVTSRRKIQLQIRLEVNSSTAMKDAVIQCGLSAVLPAHAMQEEIHQGLVRAIPITHPAIRQTTFIETTRQRPLSLAARQIEKLLSTEVGNLR